MFAAESLSIATAAPALATDAAFAVGDLDHSVYTADAGSSAAVDAAALYPSKSDPAHTVSAVAAATTADPLAAFAIDEAAMWPSMPMPMPVMAHPLLYHAHGAQSTLAPGFGYWEPAMQRAECTTPEEAFAQQFFYGNMTTPPHSRRPSESALWGCTGNETPTMVPSPASNTSSDPFDSDAVLPSIAEWDGLVSPASLEVNSTAQRKLDHAQIMPLLSTCSKEQLVDMVKAFCERYRDAPLASIYMTTVNAAMAAPLTCDTMRPSMMMNTHYRRKRSASSIDQDSPAPSSSSSSYSSHLSPAAPRREGRKRPRCSEGFRGALPSYADMILEALRSQAPAADAFAAREIFAWIAKAYPVNATFKASCNQALQRLVRDNVVERTRKGFYRLAC